MGERPSVSAAQLAITPMVRFRADFLEEVRRVACDDKAWMEFKKSLEEKTKMDKNLSLIDGVLYYKTRLWIPDAGGMREAVLASEHDSMVAGHFGQEKTLEVISRNFYWPSLDKIVDDYVLGCPIFQTKKATRNRRQVLLQALEPPSTPWSSVSMEFIVELPES